MYIFIMLEKQNNAAAKSSLKLDSQNILIIEILCYFVCTVCTVQVCKVPTLGVRSLCNRTILNVNGAAASQCLLLSFEMHEYYYMNLLPALAALYICAGPPRQM
jgi:hypothetical protein